MWVEKNKMRVKEKLIALVYKREKTYPHAILGMYVADRTGECINISQELAEKYMYGTNRTVLGPGEHFSNALQKVQFLKYRATYEKCSRSKPIA